LRYRTVRMTPPDNARMKPTGPAPTWTKCKPRNRQPNGISSAASFVAGPCVATSYRVAGERGGRGDGAGQRARGGWRGGQRAGCS
jgi:hypothetical protein